MDLASWRDVAIVILIIEAFVLALVPAVAFYYAIRGLRELRRMIDPLFPRAQERLWRVAQVSQCASAALVRPFVALGGLQGGIYGLARAVVSPKASRPTRITASQTSGESAPSTERHET